MWRFRRILYMHRQKRFGRPNGTQGVSGHGTWIPKYGQRSGILAEMMCRKPLTKRGFRRILLGKEFAPRKGVNYYGHPKTI